MDSVQAFYKLKRLQFVCIPSPELHKASSWHFSSNVKSITGMMAVHACSSQLRCKGVVELSPPHLGYILFMVHFIHHTGKCKVFQGDLVDCKLIEEYHIRNRLPASE